MRRAEAQEVTPAEAREDTPAEVPEDPEEEGGINFPFFFEEFPHKTTNRPFTYL